jgi:hypothetical protein
MKGRKIIYNREYLDNYFHGAFSKDPIEAEKIKHRINCESTINSNFINPYNRVNLAPKRVKLIK